MSAALTHHMQMPTTDLRTLPFFLRSPSAKCISSNDERTTWEVTSFGPIQAQAVLAHMTGDQRPLRASGVAAYAKDMHEGRWRDLGQPLVVFNAEGWCIDGQHRVHAVIASQAVLPIVTIVQSFHADAAENIDLGKPRTVADLRKMSRLKAISGSVAAAVALDAVDFVPHRVNALGTHERHLLVTECKHLDALLDLHANHRKIPVQSGALGGALRCLSTTTSPAKAIAFFKAAFANEHNVGGEPCGPARALANFLIKAKTARRDRMQQRACAAAAIHAWNAFRRGSNSDRIRVEQDTFPEALP